MAKKAPSAAKQVKTEWLGLGTIVKLVIGDCGYIMYLDHFAQLLTMETSEAVKHGNGSSSRPACVKENRQFVAFVEAEARSFRNL